MRKTRHAVCRYGLILAKMIITCTPRREDSMPLAPLQAESLYRACEIGRFDFDTTAEWERDMETLVSDLCGLTPAAFERNACAVYNRAGKPEQSGTAGAQPFVEVSVDE
jgi:hypothetical protein